MNIIISNSIRKPIYEQITSQIKNMIMSGQLREGDMLPSMRTLAKELRISLITTKRAYSELEKEGFIKTITGKGSFIAMENLELIKGEQLKKVEDELEKIVNIAKSNGITYEEIKEILDIVYKGE